MKGHCLCGAVSFTSPDSREIGACHCGFCRRWGGGPLLAVHCGPDVQFQGADQIGVFSSSEWAERAFCKKCGTHCYGRGHLAELGGDFVSFSYNTVDDLELSELKVVYWDGRHDNWYAGPSDKPWPMRDSKASAGAA